MSDDSGESADEPDLIRLVFDLPQDDDGWPPVARESLWAIRLGEDIARVDNTPFFVRGLALADVVRFEADEDGVLCAREVLEEGGSCTIRVIPAGGGHREEKRQEVLDAFAPLGVEGEGIGRFGLVALTVPPTADVGQVKRLLVDGHRRGRWEYEEGSITSAWRAAE